MVVDGGVVFSQLSCSLVLVQLLRVQVHTAGHRRYAAMNALQSWVDAGYVNPGQTTDDDFYGSKISALAWVGHWMYNTHKDELGEDSILVPMPDFGGGAATPRRGA